MTGKLDEVLRFHQDALDVRAHRQQLLASNIANADTPGYKARDIDFAQAMQNAVSLRAGQASPGLVKTSSNHLQSRDGGIFGVAPQYRVPTQASIDGNTVEMNQERAAFSENAIHYEANLTFINHKLKLLLAAIQG